MLGSTTLKEYAMSVTHDFYAMLRKKQKQHLAIVNDVKQMTVQDLIDDLIAIEDKTTLVAHENGDPVHYTCHGMAGHEANNKNVFFIGAL